MRVLLAHILILSAVLSYAEKPPKLKPIRSNVIHLSEPSGVSFNKRKNNLIIVGDNGKLFETDLEGKIIRESDYRGVDFEAVVVVGDLIYVAEESQRSILVFDASSLQFKYALPLDYDGARNKGIEALSYNDETHKFWAFTERDPIWGFEFDSLFHIQKRLLPHFSVSDISDACFHNGYLWVLSDENHILLKITIDNFIIAKAWRLPVVNPEGMTFVNNELVVASDAMQMIYWFKPE